MISRVRLVRFKRFSDQEFDLSGDTVLLAGPNNSGKSTLLQALAAWNLALRRWREERGDSGGQRRLGIGLDEFTALPLREMNLLWLNRHTAVNVPEKKTPSPAPVFIEVVSSRGERVEESLTMEFLYADKRLVYVRPVKGPVTGPEKSVPMTELPEFARKTPIVHVPAFSGIGSQETHYANTSYLNKLIGDGKPGDIIRNLLLEIWNKSTSNGDTEHPVAPRAELSPWKDLASDMRRLFQCELLPPQSGTYIVSEYCPHLPHDPTSKARPPRLDIANAGSGFHQVLLLLAFLYARPSSVLLLDEPDAHLHFILQQEIFDHLRSITLQRRCKLILATHSEVLLDGASHDQIISFVGSEPRRLARPGEKQHVKDALRRLTSTDFLRADQVKAVLYVEDESDHKLLREWAAILCHGATRFLQFPFVVPLKGKGNLHVAKKHFQSLQLARPGIRGLCVLDRDDDVAGGDAGMPAGLELRRWKRYEIENYMLIPDVLKRHVQTKEPLPLLSSPDMQLIDDEFRTNFPPLEDYLKDIPALRDLKGSEFVVDLLSRTSFPLSKQDLFVLAKMMRPTEIHPDVYAMLDALAGITPTMSANMMANMAPLDDNGTEEELED